MTPRVLLVGHYPLDRLDGAPRVRIAALRDALSERVDLTWISADRTGRRAPLAELGPRVGSFDAVYVEAATSTATPWDLAFLMRVKAAGVPLGLYVRDAYQRFGYQYAHDTLRRRVLALAWEASIQAYRQLADVLFFPTEGLASLFEHPRKRLLPPGAREVAGVDRSAPERRVIYAGGVSETLGSDLLLSAMDQVVAQLPDARLTFVTAAQDHPLIAPWRDRPWLDLMHVDAPDLLPVMNRAAVAAIPFRDADYPALPVKLFDYLAHRMPIVATDSETSGRAFLWAHGCAHLVPATAEGLTGGLVRVLTDPAEARALEAASARALAGNTWGDRADALLAELLGGRAPAPATMADRATRSSPDGGAR